MANSVFQKAYDWIGGIKTPAWLVELLSALQEIILSIALDIGKQYMDAIKTKIVEVAGTDMSNEEKFKAVFNYAREQLLLIKITDAQLNLLIEFFVNLLKKDKTI